MKEESETTVEVTRERVEKPNKITEKRFGKITGKYVIYRGKTQDVDGIQYLNIEEYLNNLDS